MVTQYRAGKDELQSNRSGRRAGCRDLSAMRFEANAISRWPARIYAVLIQSLNGWIDHRGGSKGAALALYTLFGIE